MQEICVQAHAAGAWVHVDGAFGLWAAAAPERATLPQGSPRPTRGPPMPTNGLTSPMTTAWLSFVTVKPSERLCRRRWRPFLKGAAGSLGSIPGSIAPCLGNRILGQHSFPSVVQEWLILSSVLAAMHRNSPRVCAKPAARFSTRLSLIRCLSRSAVTKRLNEWSPPSRRMALAGAAERCGMAAQRCESAYLPGQPPRRMSSAACHRDPSYGCPLRESPRRGSLPFLRGGVV